MTFELLFKFKSRNIVMTCNKFVIFEDGIPVFSAYAS